MKLKPGLKVLQDGEVFTLIERAPSWREDDIPFCVADHTCDSQVVHARQRWKVDIDGFITHRYVSYFYGIGHVSAECSAWHKKGGYVL